MHPTKTVLLIIAGGIAAYKSLDLIRRLRDQEVQVRCILTAGGRQFVTPLSVASLSGQPAAELLLDAESEAQFDHIRLSRSADLIVIAPATANLLARMAAGMASDLASTVILASDAPVLAAPAMNPRMWSHPATQRNVAKLQGYGVEFIGPDAGDMACGEHGSGRMVEPAALTKFILSRLRFGRTRPQLAGLRAVVTLGPTYEPLDPVRFIGNRSSGRQGGAIAVALAAAGCRVTAVVGPGESVPLPGCEIRAVETAHEMREAVLAALPADMFIGTAAVADWRPDQVSKTKIKKTDGKGAAWRLPMVANPDILAEVAGLPATGRPRLVVGFAAETGNPLAAARKKRTDKGCDWILANDVSPEKMVFSSDLNQVVLISEGGEETWPESSKGAIAARLVEQIAQELKAGARR